MDYTNEVGLPKRITTSGLTCISAINCALLGVWSGVQAATTAPTVNLYTGTTASNAVAIIGTSTLALNGFARIPAFCVGGLLAQVSNDHVDVTIFYNPSSTI